VTIVLVTHFMEKAERLAGESLSVKDWADTADGGELYRDRRRPVARSLRNGNGYRCAMLSYELPAFKL
jgi:hypothetical protein